MNGYDVKRLALVFAIQAEIEGMKAENINDERCGLENTYAYDDFSEKSEELRILANQHDEQL